MHKRLIPILTVLTVSLGLWLGATSPRIVSWWDDVRQPKLPVAENVNEAITNTVQVNDNTNETVTNTVVTLPTEKNLAVPFTSQAPSANWDADHEEFCEEAAIVMAGRYYQGRGFTSTDDKESALQAVKKWEVDHLGFFFDTTAAENKQILEAVYGLKVELLRDPTIEQIQAAVAAGHPVIVPSAGRELGNPNFTAPGPIYHNLVIRGYTKDGKFITNDPGTRKGEAYVYDQDVIMSAMHDWVPAGARTTAANGDANGAKVVLIILPL